MECAAASANIPVFSLPKPSVAGEGMVPKSGRCVEEGTKSGAVREKEEKYPVLGRSPNRGLEEKDKMEEC